MNILLVTEKPSVARCIAPFARRHWPDAHITCVNAIPYGNFKFAYPRGMKWSDYPMVSAPQHKLSAWAQWLCAPLVVDAAGATAPTVMSETLFFEADLIVSACDPDHTGAVSFEILLRQVFGDDRARECPALKFCAIDDASLQKAFATLRPFGEAFPHELAYGLVKRHFDWNWNLNALAILGETGRRVGVAADAPPMSKYALQLLYAMRQWEALSEGKIIDRMHKWPGTGRYTYKASEWRPRLGSVASSCQIIENLLEADLLKRNDRELIVSERGIAFLEALHPDCCDPDLPFRLDAWCHQGRTSQSAVERYIRTFFGKQKRFLDATT